MELLLEHVGRGFVNMLFISMPIVLIAAIIGLVVGILQAVTQVQEQTIAAAPKILGVFIGLMAMSGLFMKIMTEYFEDSFTLAFNVVTKQDDFILPPEGMYPTKNKEEKDYSSLKKPDIRKLMNTPGKMTYYQKKYDPSKVTGTDRSPGVEPDLVEKRRLYTGK